MAGVGNQGMQPMIQVVNNLQDAFSASGLPFGLVLPQIVVVGGQSAGKSSVLENFVGKDFLPRGAGIVTRRPLILQLHYSKDEEYAEFLHLPNKKFTDFDDVRHEIEAETDRETGSNKGISRKPINLRVHSPNVLDLTLVDLPGMTRVPVGDQPQDIERQIREMVLEFVKKENSLILAVSPANADLANSDAMNIAKQVDPEGNRTIGVITKLDLMDEGTDARDVLTGKVLPLKRGYVGVVNRSQKDIEGRKDIQQAMAGEREFFQQNPAYRDLAERMGTPFLQQVLNRELNRHIQETLPNIRNQLRTRILEVKKELSQYTDITSPKETRIELLRVLQEFADDVQGDIEGQTAGIDTDRLAAGAEINRLFYNEFSTALALDKLSNERLEREITFAIRNIYGVRTGLFTPDLAFNATVVKIIESFKEQVTKCVDLVGGILTKTTDKSADKLSKYTKLKEEVGFLVKEHIQEQEDVSKKQLMIYVDAEIAFQNVRHEDFITKATMESSDPTKSVGDVRRQLNVTNQVIEKGWINLQKKGKVLSSGKQWFVLRPDNLSWYKDQHDEEAVFSLQLTPKMKIKTDQKKHRITLFHVDSKNLTPDSKSLDLQLETTDSMDHWVLCLEEAGVRDEASPNDESDKPSTKKSVSRDESREEPESPNRKKSESGDEPQSPNTNSGVQAKMFNSRMTKRVGTFEYSKSMKNPEQQKQTGVIKLMVDSYLKIVSKTVRDLVPKYIMLLLVNNIVNFVTKELVGRILAEQEPTKLMVIDPQVTEHIKALKRSQEAAQQALEIINQASLPDA